MDQPSIGPHPNTPLEVTEDDSTDTDTIASTDIDTDADSDGPEETQFDNILLDDCSEDGTEDDSSEDEGQDGGVVAAAAVVVAADETDPMEIDEGITTPVPQQNGRETPLQFQAGCVWVEADWSCAYDAVFMAFFTIYWQSSPGWRSDWRQQTPEWTAQLADHFDLLLGVLNSGGNSREGLSTLFSDLRDQFRDQLSGFSQQKFPRRGREPASVCKILELLFGSVVGPGVDRNLGCTRCGAVSQTSHNFPFLAYFQQGYRQETDPRFIPSETLLTRFIDTRYTSLDLPRCDSCNGVRELQSITMEDLPWIWFETERKAPMAPSLTIHIDLLGQHLTYDLYSIIYLGGRHFTARMRDPSNDWWNYDGMWRLGAPRRDHIQHPTDLLWNGYRYAAFFIYRRSDH